MKKDLMFSKFSWVPLYKFAYGFHKEDKTQNSEMEVFYHPEKGEKLLLCGGDGKLRN